MIDIYLTDEITIVNKSSDKWGVITKTEIPNIPARVEDVNIMVKDKEGKEVFSNTYITVGLTQTISYESTIKITKKNDAAYPLATKEMSILKLEKAGGFSTSHYEVWL
jgi:intein-encoded DNA endonuclease-like protein